jgi:cyclic pyranopterin phosphate synthase
MARDSYGREIDYLRVSVTDRCNLGCIYCMPGRKPRCFHDEELLTVEELERIARVAMGFGLRKIRLTGGEPLLRPDILDIIFAIKGQGVRDLSLTTNGILLSRMAGALREAGLDRVNVSLDTLDPLTFKRITDGGDLERVLAGIRAAERAGLNPVKINMVPMRGINDGEIVDFARLTLEKPYHVRFIEFMPAGRERFWDEDVCVKVSEAKERVETLGKLVKRKFRGKGPSRNYRLEGAEGLIGFISAVSHSFCYSCNRLRMNSVGKIKPCLFSSTWIDIRTPMRSSADDDALRRLFALAVEVKPEGNYLQKKEGASIDSMSSIGG